MQSDDQSTGLMVQHHDCDCAVQLEQVGSIYGGDRIPQWTMTGVDYCAYAQRIRSLRDRVALGDVLKRATLMMLLQIHRQKHRTRTVIV